MNTPGFSFARLHQRYKVCILDFGSGKPQEPQKGCVPCTRNSRLLALL
nr:MAG TPA: protein of unknown function (DUF953) [Caudoviricetes sp.]